MPAPKVYDIEYILSRVVIADNGCWIWQGALDRHGYGAVTISSGERSSHRLSYKLHKGEIPVGLSICHTCDNPPCCNPDHLVAASHADNMADALNKNRFPDRSAAWTASVESRKIPRHIVEEVITRVNKGEHKESIANSLRIGRTTVYRIINSTNQGTDHE